MSRKLSYKYISAFAFLLGLTRLTAATVRDRITLPVDVNRTTTLTGNVQRQAQPQFDRGPVDPAMPMRHMVLIVQPSSVQQGELDQLLADRQNPSSPQYRRWLSPEEFGDRFGLSRSDHSKVVAWLSSAGFTVDQSGRGRNWIAFSGNAGQVSRTFHTPIDRFTVNGKEHYANTASPSVPEALAGVVGGFLGLSNFRPHSMIGKVTPEDTIGTTHYLAPQDWATIYDVAPLYQAGFNGAGQSIAVVGASDVTLADIQVFRKRFGLPANDPKMTLYADDPGYNDAELEGDLDLEWAGAIAPNATIYYVYGDDPFSATVAAVDMNVAPVVTISYGSCEIDFAIGFWRAIAQQANAQGITILNSSGDAGAAGCDGGEQSAFAVSGLTADFPAVLPEVTGVGGTQFLDATGSYWADASGNLAPTATVTRGGMVTFYMVGAGEVAPQVLTGYGPTVAESRQFQPWLPLSVTVGGTEVFVVETQLTPSQFGTTQVSILVPSSVPAGVQPVVATVGGASSPPVNVTVQ